MNQDSEQLTAEYNIILAQDQPLSPKKLREAVIDVLGSDCDYEEVCGKNQIVFHNGRHKTVLLCKNITYLGNPHPVFKKRIQIPRSWLEMTREMLKYGYDVRFIGVYHFNGFLIFADFDKETYLNHNCNNSAAHVYVNDLYQGSNCEMFSKIDQFGNKITTISSRYFSKFLKGEKIENTLLELFTQFNNGFNFGQWMTAIETIQEMHQKHWSQWRQAEWAGWFLEYKFAHFTQKEEVSPFIEYTALSNKTEGALDFDLWFPRHEFMGDLKASDISKSKAPGNDQEALIECIKKYNKFWYIIYEHETIKDSEKEYKATLFRNNYIKMVDNTPEKEFDPMSYHQRMKHSVKFTNMCVLELNRINMHKVLSAFNQGHQPSGEKRKPKFVINKKDIDNYVVYRYRVE